MKRSINIYVFLALAVVLFFVLWNFSLPLTKLTNGPIFTKQTNDGSYENGELQIPKWGVKGSWPEEYKDVVVKVSEQGNHATFYSASVSKNVAATNCSWCENEKNLETTLFSLEKEDNGIKDAGGQYLSEQDLAEGLEDGLFVKIGNSYYREGSSALSGAQPSDTIEEKKALAILEKFAKSGTEFKKSLQVTK